MLIKNYMPKLYWISLISGSMNFPLPLNFFENFSDTKPEKSFTFFENLTKNRHISATQRGPQIQFTTNFWSSYCQNHPRKQHLQPWIDISCLSMCSMNYKIFEFIVLSFFSLLYIHLATQNIRTRKNYFQISLTNDLNHS